jgi:nucleotide-binding universal stress UspA family protein
VVDVRSYVLDRVAASALPYLKGKSAFSLEELEEVGRLAQTRLRDAFGTVTTNGGEALVVRGYAVDGIVQTAVSSQAALVVLGAYGCGSEDGPATFGRTVAGVIAAAPCSVLVVRESRQREAR